MCHKTLFFLWLSSTLLKYILIIKILKKQRTEQVSPTDLPLLTSRIDPGNQCIKWAISRFYIPMIQMTVIKPCLLCPLQEEFQKTPEKIIRVLNPISATTSNLDSDLLGLEGARISVFQTNKNIKTCVILILSRFRELLPL